MPDSPPIPAFLYGTAWKEDRTAALTELAIRAGFRGIDTASQRRHYFEAGVGEGLAAAYKAGIVTRRDLFLQTKFTYRAGQDHRLPYHPDASLTDQVSRTPLQTSSFGSLLTLTAGQFAYLTEAYFTSVDLQGNPDSGVYTRAIF